MSRLLWTVTSLLVEAGSVMPLSALPLPTGTFLNMFTYMHTMTRMHPKAQAARIIWTMLRFGEMMSLTLGLQRVPLYLSITLRQKTPWTTCRAPRNSCSGTNLVVSILMATSSDFHSVTVLRQTLTTRARTLMCDTGLLTRRDTLPGVIASMKAFTDTVISLMVYGQQLVAARQQWVAPGALLRVASTYGARLGVLGVRTAMG